MIKYCIVDCGGGTSSWALTPTNTGFISYVNYFMCPIRDFLTQPKFIAVPIDITVWIEECAGI